MCKAILLNNNTLGCVVSCPCCTHIQVGFGNVMSVFSHKEFNCFTSHINSLYTKHYTELITNNNKIFLHTDTEKLFLALNADELKGLCDLLRGAEIMLYVNKILHPESQNK